MSNDLIIEKLKEVLIMLENGACAPSTKSFKSVSEAPIFLTVREASRYLNVSESLLRKWIFNKIIEPTRFGGAIRFNRAELDFFIKTNKGNL